MSNLTIHEPASAITIKLATVCYSAKDFEDHEIIWLERGSGALADQFVLNFGRGACKAVITNMEAARLQTQFGVCIK